MLSSDDGRVMPSILAVCWLMTPANADIAERPAQVRSPVPEKASVCYFCNRPPSGNVRNTGCTMSAASRALYLRIALVVIGLACIFGFYPLSVVWPSGWTWGQSHSHYLTMIMGLYATLGVFLLMASRDPDAHKSIIWFTVWSSVVHAAIMAWQAFGDAAERG